MTATFYLFFVLGKEERGKKEGKDGSTVGAPHYRVATVVWHLGVCSGLPEPTMPARLPVAVGERRRGEGYLRAQLGTNGSSAYVPVLAGLGQYDPVATRNHWVIIL